MLFPGYLFLQTEIDAELIAKQLRNLFRDRLKYKNVYSILHYGSNHDNVVLNKNELSFWERLFDDEYCVSGSTGFIEGDRIKVMSGALQGYENTIKKINRHKREVTIEIELMGRQHEVRLMLEIIRKMD